MGVLCSIPEDRGYSANEDCKQHHARLSHHGLTPYYHADHRGRYSVRRGGNGPGRGKAVGGKLGGRDVYAAPFEG